MNKKKKLLFLIIILIILIFCCKKIFYQKSVNYKLQYKNNIFNVMEKKDKKNYYISIKSNEDTYLFDLRLDKAHGKVIDKIYYYEDSEYKCLLPITNNKLLVDMVCYKNNILYNYTNIVGKNNKLDKFISTIDEYDISKFSDDLSKVETISSSKFYIKNEIQHIVSLTTYKGIIIDNKVINLFNNDVYDNKLSTFVDNYYIIADYDNEYEFEYFYVVNLLNKEIFKIKSKNTISLDSYIQGVVDKKVYLYDKDNEIQYEINIDKKRIDIVSKDSKIKYYKNNNWTTISKITANKELFFNYESLDNNYTDYDKVIESDKYFYLFKEKLNGYDLYRVDKNNINIIKYIMEIPTIDIKYNSDYIYYLSDNKIYYYSDLSGIRTILEDSELEFNNTIKYYIY